MSVTCGGFFHSLALLFLVYGKGRQLLLQTDAGVERYMSELLSQEPIDVFSTHRVVHSS